MSTRSSPEKMRRIDYESQFIDFQVIDMFSEAILEPLTLWANENIYKPQGGTLSLERPFNESANACASVDRRRPLHGTIKINMGMIKEIYRDSFVFPLFSEQFVLDSPNISDLNTQFGNQSFTFSAGLPELPESRRSELYKTFKDAIAGTHPRWTDNVVAARFMYFEITLVWVFFHELSHLIQCHYLLKPQAPTATSSLVEHYEMRSNASDPAENLKEQAREVLADLEGIDLTVKYMIRNKLYSSSSMYLLMCSTGCMFNRFYEQYGEDFELGVNSHPHPVIRSEFSGTFICHLITHYLLRQKAIEKKEDAAIPLLYLSIRASLMSGIFWAWRYEKFDSGNLSSFMALSTTLKENEREECGLAIQGSMNEQLCTIGAHHLQRDNFLAVLADLPPFFRKRETASGG